MAQSIEDWWVSIGPVTRVLLIHAIIVGLIATTGSVSLSYLTMSFDQLVRTFQPWRPLTGAVFFGKFSFNWLLSVGFLVTFLRLSENHDYTGEIGDMVWMLILIDIILLLETIVLSIPFSGFAFSMAVCWIFCKRHPEQNFRLFFVEVKGSIFPWAQLCINFILGLPLEYGVGGILAGHTVFFLLNVLPNVYNSTLFLTPTLISKIFPSKIPKFGSLYHKTVFMSQTSTSIPKSHEWGKGRRLNE